MIVLIGFDGLERSLFEKASAELQIDKRISYFDRMSDVFEWVNSMSAGSCPTDFPRVLVMNIDAPHCRDDLEVVKSTSKWQKIPVIGYGFFEDQSDVNEFYGAGGASCIRKPQSYAELIDTTRAAMGYWLSMSILPCDYLREA